MITNEMIKEMQKRELAAIGGTIYISQGKVIGAAKARMKYGSATLNRFYTMNIDASKEEYIEFIDKIMQDSLYCTERGIDFCDEKDDEIGKQIKKDKKDKKIDNSSYINIYYCYSDYLMNKFSVTLCERDGSAWIGRETNTYQFEKNDLDLLVEKIKSFNSKKMI